MSMQNDASKSLMEHTSRAQFTPTTSSPSPSSSSSPPSPSPSPSSPPSSSHLPTATASPSSTSSSPPSMSPPTNTTAPIATAAVAGTASGAASVSAGGAAPAVAERSAAAGGAGSLAFKRRIRGPGSSGMHNPYWENDDSITFDSFKGAPFAAQQYLQYVLSVDRSNLQKVCEVPPGCDPAVWQYEHIRQLVVELNQLTVVLSKTCTPASCPVMNATDEWQYLCAAHKTPRECSAIDYIVHTLDGTSALLCLSKAFPSRTSIPESSLHYFQSIMRRLYRIFSHAYFHHKEQFMAFEDEKYLCRRFVHFSSQFKLISRDQFIIPEEGY